MQKSYDSTHFIKESDAAQLADNSRKYKLKGECRPGKVASGRVFVYGSFHEVTAARPYTANSIAALAAAGLNALRLPGTSKTKTLRLIVSKERVSLQESRSVSLVW